MTLRLTCKECGAELNFDIQQFSYACIVKVHTCGCQSIQQNEKYASLVDDIKEVLAKMEDKDD